MESLTSFYYDRLTPGSKVWFSSVIWLCKEVVLCSHPIGHGTYLARPSVTYGFLIQKQKDKQKFEGSKAKLIGF